MKRIVSTALSVVVAFSLCSSSLAAIPQTLGYQGYLSNLVGQPVNTPVVMTFRLYDSEVGGSAIWTEAHPSVAVSNGTFNVQLGSITPLALQFDSQYWLTITANADGEMSPRQPLLATPYARRSGAADSLSPGATLSGAQISGTLSNASIAASQVTGSVGSTQVADNAITSQKLADGAVTKSKLSAPGGSAGQFLVTDGTSLSWRTHPEVAQCAQADIAGNWLAYLQNGNGTKVCSYSMDGLGSISGGACSWIDTNGDVSSTALVTGSLVSGWATPSVMNLLPGDGTGVQTINGIVGLPSGNQSRTYTGWIKLAPSDINPPNALSLIGHGTSTPSGGYHRVGLLVWGNGNLGLDFQVGSVNAVAPVFDGMVHFIAATYTTSGVAMYLDGAPLVTTAGVNGFTPGAVNTINVAGNPATFGYEYGLTSGSTDTSKKVSIFKGGISNAGIWNVALTAGQISTLHSIGNQYPSGFPAPLAVGFVNPSNTTASCTFRGTWSTGGETTVVTATLTPDRMSAIGMLNLGSSGTFSSTRVP